MIFFDTALVLKCYFFEDSCFFTTKLAAYLERILRLAHFHRA